MISLKRHIELLLLEHDCVIVPGFGGFIANHAEARYDEGGDKLFLPPYRTVAFNRDLKMNDGLLVQNYMQAYDAAYPEACLQMEKDVESLMAELDIVGSVVMDGIGTFTKDINQNITFTSEMSGLLTPELYGLYSFEQQTLAEALKARELSQAMEDRSALNIATEKDRYVAPPTEAASEEACADDKRHIVIRMNRRWMDVSIAIAASIVLFFCLAIPNLNTHTTVSDTCIAGSLYVAVTNQVDDKAANGDSAQTKTVQEVNKKEQAVSKTEQAVSVVDDDIKPYVIVLASRVSEPNAKAFIKQVDDMGYHEARFVSMNGINRVVYSSYASESEARTALQNMKKEKCFKDAWVIKQ